jgi:hypothetical protein
MAPRGCEGAWGVRPCRCRVGRAGIPKLGAVTSPRHRSPITIPATSPRSTSSVFGACGGDAARGSTRRRRLPVGTHHVGTTPILAKWGEVARRVNGSSSIGNSAEFMRELATPAVCARAFPRVRTVCPVSAPQRIARSADREAAIGGDCRRRCRRCGR